MKHMCVAEPPFALQHVEALQISVFKHQQTRQHESNELLERPPCEFVTLRIVPLNLYFICKTLAVSITTCHRQEPRYVPPYLYTTRNPLIAIGSASSKPRQRFGNMLLISPETIQAPATPISRAVTITWTNSDDS